MPGPGPESTPEPREPAQSAEGKAEPEFEAEAELLPEASTSAPAPYEAPAPVVPGPEARGTAPSEQEYEEWSEEESSSAAPAGRGVFDTETLAAIYVNQGFYGRAAEIYQRLLAERPGDATLRRKLEEVLDLARGTDGHGGPPGVPIQPAPAATAALMPAEVKVDRLQRLLEAFMEGRPA
jgi:hypothetical protein